MPMSYLRDDRQRIVRVTLTPPITAGEAAVGLYRMAAEKTWRYGLIVDLRRTVLGEHGARALLETARELVVTSGVMGPVAVVTWDPAAFERAAKYAELARDFSAAVEVFHHLSEAERWLEAQLGASAAE